MSDWMQALSDIIWLSQLGLSVLLPPVCCLWLASWLVNSKGAPGWTYAVLLALGLGAGAQNFRHFFALMKKRAAKKKDGRDPVNYNRHR